MVSGLKAMGLGISSPGFGSLNAKAMSLAFVLGVAAAALQAIGPRPAGVGGAVVVVGIHDGALVKDFAVAQHELAIDHAVVVHEGDHAVVVLGGGDPLLVRRVEAPGVEVDGGCHDLSLSLAVTTAPPVRRGT